MEGAVGVRHIAIEQAGSEAPGQAGGAGQVDPAEGRIACQAEQNGPFGQTEVASKCPDPTELFNKALVLEHDIHGRGSRARGLAEDPAVEEVGVVIGIEVGHRQISL